MINIICILTSSICLSTGTPSLIQESRSKCLKVIVPNTCPAPSSVFYKRGNRGTETLSHLPKSYIQLVTASCEVGIFPSLLAFISSALSAPSVPGCLSSSMASYTPSLCLSKAPNTSSFLELCILQHSS